MKPRATSKPLRVSNVQMSKKRHTLKGGSMENIKNKVKIFAENFIPQNLIIGFSISTKIPGLMNDMNSMPEKMKTLRDSFLNDNTKTFKQKITSDATFQSMYSVIYAIVEADTVNSVTLLNEIFWEALDEVSKKPGYVDVVNKVKTYVDITSFVKNIITNLVGRIKNNPMLSGFVDDVLKSVAFGASMLKKNSQKGGTFGLNTIINMVDNVEKTKLELKDKLEGTLQKTNPLLGLKDKLEGTLQKTNPLLENLAGTKGSTALAGFTALASATATDGPTATKSEGPSATATDAPIATNSEGPSAAATDAPTAAATDAPTATATDGPTATATDGPTATKSEGSTATKSEGSTATKSEGSTATSAGNTQKAKEEENPEHLPEIEKPIPIGDASMENTVKSNYKLCDFFEKFKTLFSDTPPECLGLTPQTGGAAKTTRHKSYFSKTHKRNRKTHKRNRKTHKRNQKKRKGVTEKRKGVTV